MGFVSIRTEEGVARIPLADTPRRRRRPNSARVQSRHALGLTSVLAKQRGVPAADPLARFVGCMDLGAHNVAEGFRRLLLEDPAAHS